jgi:hypothetical protein
MPETETRPEWLAMACEDGAGVVRAGVWKLPENHVAGEGYRREGIAASIDEQTRIIGVDVLAQDNRVQASTPPSRAPHITWFCWLRGPGQRQWCSR